MDKANVPSKAVLGYPYEGGLLWLLDNRGRRGFEGHPYYRVLFGPNPDAIQSRAAALTALFDEVVVAPADTSLPDHQTNVAGDWYRHPDLRISMPFGFERVGEWSHSTVAIAEKLLAEAELVALLESHPGVSRDHKEWRHLVCRIVSQVRLAREEGAVLIGDDLVAWVSKHVLPVVNISEEGEPGGVSARWQLPIDLVDLVGLDFGCRSLDALAAVRESKDVSAYSADFRAAIASAHQGEDLGRTLLQHMKAAMGKARIAELASGGFTTVGSVANWGGLIPVLGTLTTASSIVSDLAGRGAQRVERKSEWYLLGPKMKEVSLQAMLKSLD